MSVQDVQVFTLHVAPQFERLSAEEKRYAHHMARAAWHGARIILSQVSPEAPTIFDFIQELYHSCSGRWEDTVDSGVSKASLDNFLRYAATFLSNIGNYYGSGDQKFIPDVDIEDLEKLSRKSAKLSSLYDQISVAITSRPPYGLGYSSDSTQSAYYPDVHLTKDSIDAVSKILEEHSIFPENTRLRRAQNGKDFEVLVASIQTNDSNDLQVLSLPDSGGLVTLVHGDHAPALGQICTEISKASSYAANDTQRDFLSKYVESFQTGSLDSYRESLRLWVRDKSPRIENIFGFVEPYRDPHGIRAEFEGLVAIADDEETRLLAVLVQNSAKFIKRLPWASADNDGRGHFEKNMFEPPDFSSIHTLAYCSSIIFPGINLPNYNDIRQEVGFKNVIIANRMITESQAVQYPFIDESEAEQFKKHKYPAYYWWVVLHELLGHGTGKMLAETKPGVYNFDIHDRPVNPLDGNPIESWYKYGQTWTGQFADLSTTVDECRAELVGAYLMDDEELLELFGFTETSEIKTEDLTYNLYQQLGVDGLRGLANFNVDSGNWGQAHSRAHFAMLKTLLLDGNGVMTIAHDATRRSLTVRVDRSKIRTGGKAALGRMLLRLHMYRCTADVGACRAYYEDLSRVDGEYLDWRETVLTNKPPPMVFVQANTFLAEGDVILKEYPATVEGLIQSWAERNI